MESVKMFYICIDFAWTPWFDCRGDVLITVYQPLRTHPFLVSIKLM
jgi:hypothetical protein